MFSGIGARLVVFVLRRQPVGFRSRGWAGAAEPGVAGATLGTAVASPQPLPQSPQWGQAHVTVQPLTQCSFVTGQTISLWTV